VNSNALSYFKCGNRIKADKYGYCGRENSVRNALVLMVLKLVYVLAHDKVMAILYINNMHILFSSFLVLSWILLLRLNCMMWDEEKFCF